MTGVQTCALPIWLVSRVKKMPIKSLHIVAILRDWSAREAQNKENYPQSPIATIDIPLWDQDKQEQYIKDRLSLHNEAYFATHAGGDMPECTAEDMWEKPTTYAVMKPGDARAKKVCTTAEEAEHLVVTKFPDHKVEVREGGRTRCESFCQVAPFCEQYQRYQREKS